MLFFLTSGDGDGGNEGERGNAGGPQNLSRLLAFRATASIIATRAAFAVTFQRWRSGVEPTAAAWCLCPRTEPAAAAFTGA